MSRDEDRPVVGRRPRLLWVDWVDLAIGYEWAPGWLLQYAAQPSGFSCLLPPGSGRLLGIPEIGVLGQEEPGQEAVHLQQPVAGQCDLTGVGRHEIAVVPER